MGLRAGVRSRLGLRASMAVLGGVAASVAVCGLWKAWKTALRSCQGFCARAVYHPSHRLYGAVETMENPDGFTTVPTTSDCGKRGKPPTLPRLVLPYCGLPPFPQPYCQSAPWWGRGCGMVQKSHLLPFNQGVRSSSLRWVTKKARETFVSRAFLIICFTTERAGLRQELMREHSNL